MHHLIRNTEGMTEVHAENYGAHQTGPNLQMQVEKNGVLLANSKCIDLTRRCQVWQ